MAKPGATGVTRIINATGYSMKGLKSAWINEAAFRQELVLVLALMPLAGWLGDSLNEILLLICISWLVVIVEVLNSAIEAVVDRIGSEHHELSGRAKDLGSAAVFIALALNALVWGALIGRNLLGWWKSTYLVGEFAPSPSGRGQGEGCIFSPLIPNPSPARGEGGKGAKTRTCVEHRIIKKPVIETGFLLSERWAQGISAGSGHVWCR